mgnify:CR=1 FL=1
MSELEETKYGFKWGPLIVERDASDPKGGYLLSIYTASAKVEVRVTPKGQKIEVVLDAPNDWQKAKAEGREPLDV